MSYVSEYAVPLLAGAAIYGIFAMAIAGLGIAACVRARRHKDPARVGFSWLKALLTLSFLVYLVSFVNGAFNGVTYLDDYFRGIEIAQASIGIALTGNVFYRFADIAYIMTCVEIGNGFMYTLEKQRTSSQKMMRTLGLVGGVVLFILEIVYIGYGGWGWARYYNLYDSRSHSQNSLIGFTTRLDNISFAAIVITLVLFIGTLVQAATVKRTYRSVETSRQSVSIYLAATVLAIPRQLYTMIYFAIIYYGNDNQASLPVVQVPTDTILYAILWFVILVLLFCIGIRRHNGLWSTEEPWIDGAGPVLAGSQPHMWYGQQQMMYQQGAYPPQNTVMYQPQAPQPAQYGWQPQPGQQPYQPYQPSSSSPSEVPGLSPRLAPAGDPAPMLQSGPEIQPPGQVNHEMKA